MKVILLIFRKDALHLWKEILVTWVLLAWLTQLDCWRSGYLPDSNEGWLNLLLPLAWVYLAGLCVLQDPVPGERPFWLALPVRRGSVLTAKALFVAAFIQLPYLVSCAVILVARGFNPLYAAPALLMKQLTVLLVLTIPAMALASLARDAMQYLLFFITLAGGAIVITGKGSSPFQRAPGFSLTDTTKLEMVLLVMIVFFAGVLWIQYRDRRTRISRGIGLAGALAAGALYLWLPARSSAVVESELRPVAGGDAIRVQTGGLKGGHEMAYAAPNGIAVTVPLEVTGAPPQSSFWPVDFEIDSADGHRLEADRRGMGATRPQGPSLLADVMGNNLYLLMQRSIFSGAARAPVALKGHMIVRQMGNRSMRSIPITGRSDVPDLGKCSAPRAGGNLYVEDGLRVVCESPDEIPRAPIAVTDTVSGQHWNNGLGSGGNFVSYPTLTWLSPVYRSESFFPVTRALDTGAPSNWKIPIEALQHYRIDAEIVPVKGTKVVSFELRGIDLNKYVVRPSR